LVFILLQVYKTVITLFVAIRSSVEMYVKTTVQIAKDRHRRNNCIAVVYVWNNRDSIYWKQFSQLRIRNISFKVKFFRLRIHFGHFKAI